MSSEKFYEKAAAVREVPRTSEYGWRQHRYTACFLAKKNRIFLGINLTVITDEKSGFDADKGQDVSFTKIYRHYINTTDQLEQLHHKLLEAGRGFYFV